MRPSWTNVLIDGMDANDPVFGYSPAGASGLFLGLNELAEVRVLTQTYSAEYGGNGGGAVPAGTKIRNKTFSLLASSIPHCAFFPSATTFFFCVASRSLYLSP